MNGQHDVYDNEQQSLETTKQIANKLSNIKSNLNSKIPNAANSFSDKGNFVNDIDKIQDWSQMKSFLSDKASNFANDIPNKAMENARNNFNNVRDGVNNVANSLRPMSPKDAANNFKDFYKNQLENAFGNMKDSKNSLINGAKDNFNNVKEKGVKGNIDVLKNNSIKNLKNNSSVLKNLALGGAGDTGKAIGNAMDSAKTAVNTAKTIANVARGAVDPAGAALSVAKDFLKQMAEDPSKAMKKVLYVCGCCCTAVLTPILLLIMMIMIVLSMFFGMLTNDSSKNDSPKAADSWVYKYGNADYKSVLDQKVDVKPSETYIVSHNAKMQEEVQKDKNNIKNYIKNPENDLSKEESGDQDYEKPIVDEHSEDMKKSNGYTDEVIYIYKEADLKSEKFLFQGKYGDTVVAHIADGAKEASITNGFVPIEIETSESGRGQDYYTEQENKEGIPNPNNEQYNKEIFYIEKRMVFKREQHDPKLEYTIQDEYEVMSMALKKALNKKQDASLKAGNDRIDSTAKQYKDELKESDVVNNEKFKIAGAAIVKDNNGNIIKALSAIEDPNYSTFDAATSRSNLSSSVKTNLGTSQDVATILSGYAASKADSLPDKNYYNMLDTTMMHYLKNSLDLSTPPLSSQKKERVLSTKTTKEINTLRADAQVNGILVYAGNDSYLNSKNYTRYLYINPISMSDKDYRLHPKGIDGIKSDAKSYDGIYIKSDLKRVVDGVFFKSSYGSHMLLTPKQYADYINQKYSSEKTAVDYIDYVRKYYIYEDDKVTIVDDDSRKDESYEHDEYVAHYSITPLNANEVVWHFFEDSEFYPMIKNKKKAKDVNGKEIDIMASNLWSEKLKLTRSLPYYQQQLSYIFDNSGLKEEDGYFKGSNPLYGYPGEPQDIYFKVIPGAAANDTEKISFNEFKELFGDKKMENDSQDAEGNMINYKKQIIESSSPFMTENSAGVSATKKKFLWLIPIGYKQEYRRSSEPEKIQSVRLDPETGEYIKKYSKGNNGASGLPDGSAIEPVKGWRDSITSPYGMRDNPTGPGTQFHHGIDIAKPHGTPIYSVFDGEVIISAGGWNYGYGEYIKIKRADGLTALYAHNSKRLVQVGDKVKAGQQISEMGTTGNSTGPHLHFEVSKDGTNEGRYDPMEFLNGNLGTVSSTPSVGENANTTEEGTPGSTYNEEPVGEDYQNKEVIMSVGNKMDYWYDNIMQLLDDEDGNSTNGNGGQMVADLAMSYLGDIGGVYFKNSYANRKDAIKETPGNTFHWCAAFVSVIMKDAGFYGDTAVAPWSFGVITFKEWAEKEGRMKDDDGSYIPKPGDLIIYDFDNDGVFDHIGFIYSADSSGYKTIEGNTGGPGAQSGNIWYGMVNSHEHKYNASANIKFLDVPYPEVDTLEGIILSYVPKILGTNTTKVDSFGRIGIGGWYGSDAVAILRKIQAANPEEVKAIIAETQNGSKIQEFIDGKVSFDQSYSTAIKKILNIKQSRKIQEDYINARIKTIDKLGEGAYGEGWTMLEPKAKVFLIFNQLVMDMYTEKGWLTDSDTKTLIKGVIDKKGDFNTLYLEVTASFKDLHTQKSKYLDYDSWEDLANVGGVKTFNEFYKPLSTTLSHASSSVKNIPNDKLNFGLGKGKVWNIPDGLGATKTYMGNHMLTARGTEQYRLKQYTKTGPNGVGIINGRLTIAMYVGGKGSPKGYGEVGDMVDIQLSTGQIIHAVIADAKAIESDFGNYGVNHNFTLEYAKKWGIHNDGSMVEFVLNTQTIGRYPDYVPNFSSIYPGTVKKVVNLGPIKLP